MIDLGFLEMSRNKAIQDPENAIQYLLEGLPKDERPFMEPIDYRNKRLTLGLSIRGVTRLTGIDHNYISLLERRLLNKPSKVVITKLINLYNSYKR